ncbi:BAG family molecular chaperone regulator 4 isoform X1 [Eucyclogobius newberryi]|uniref:BAG family molecular chaperone regulator 4 isoform X1 n=1 Tax=Eucyclogobius newberryi TaxID=166745 RepID=UPI003B5B21FB
MHHHQNQRSSKFGWPSENCNSENNKLISGSNMDASQYHYWYPQSHSTGHYANTYPAGSEVQPQYSPQVLPEGYPNGHGVYSPPQTQYSSGFHPSNPFYCADPQRPAPYPNPGCPAEQSSGPSGQQHSQHLHLHQHHHYPGQHCQGGSGYPPGAYPHYGEGGHPMPSNPPYPTGQPVQSPSPEAWTHSGAYAPPQQQWPPGQQPPQNPYGNPVRPPHPPAWPGTGTGAPPPYQPKEQRLPSVGPKPKMIPNSSNGKSAEISSPPQMYNRPNQNESSGPNQTPAQSQSPAPGQPTSQPLSENPSLAKVQQVMARVLLLQEDVDEFVGKKIDKSYRCLEELLTKELLVLDSVETRGQENVRQARKEAVQKIQTILDQLEKKAF